MKVELEPSVQQLRSLTAADVGTLELPRWTSRPGLHTTYTVV